MITCILPRRARAKALRVQSTCSDKAILTIAAIPTLMAGSIYAHPSRQGLNGVKDGPAGLARGRSIPI